MENQEMLRCLACLSCFAAFALMASPFVIGIALRRLFTRKERQQQHQEKDLELRRKRAEVELAEAEAAAKRRKLQQPAPTPKKRLPCSVNVNLANATLIAGVLPGIGMATAKRIVSNRPVTGYKGIPDLIAKVKPGKRQAEALRKAGRKIKFK